MTRRLPHLAVFILLPALAAGCSNMRTVSLDTMRPAEVSFPSGVDRLLIVDRTIYKGDALDLLESVLSGELPGEDRSGVQSWISAFQAELMASPRFETAVAEEMLPGNSLTAAFPPQIPWSTVEDLNRRYQTDAVVAIEIYDSDFIVKNGKREKTADGAGETAEVSYFAEGTGNILIGVRVYDPRARSIIDQRLYRQNDSWEASGVSLKEAVEKLINKGDATRALSRRVGNEFAHRIAPMPVKLKRAFYGKSDKAPAMELGSRYADVGKWREAADAWEAGIDRAPPKEAGQLAYNIAIAHEVLGDYPLAREWAEKAYVQYDNDKARAYVTDLDNRLYAEELAQQQMR